MYLGSCQFRSLLEMCRESGSLEIGGLLIGRYNNAHDTAEVTRVLGPPSDSVRRQNSFWRGVRGLQNKLNSLWKSGEYYLGEWHYHPGGPARPSPSDIRQMTRISESPKYRCPEPILIVVGGSDWEVVGRVFPRRGSSVTLKPQMEASEGRDTVCCSPV